MNKPNGARSSLVLAVSLLLAAAFSPTSLAASEQPRPVSAATTAFALKCGVSVPLLPGRIASDNCPREGHAS